MIFDTPQLTGRTRRLTYTGTMAAQRGGYAGTTPAFGPGPTCIVGTGIAGRSSDGAVAFWAPWDSTLGPPTVYFDGNAGSGNYGAGLNAQTLGSAPDYAADAHTLPRPVNWTYYVDATYIAYADVEEWTYLELPDATEDTYIDGLPFDTFNQNAMPDGVPALRRVFFEATKVGGAYLASITSGSATASVSGTIGSSVVVGYAVTGNISHGAVNMEADSKFTCVWVGGDPYFPDYIYTDAGAGTVGPVSISILKQAHGFEMTGAISPTIYTDACDPLQHGNLQSTFTIAPPIERKYAGRIRAWDEAYPDAGLSVAYPTGSTPVTSGLYGSDFERIRTYSMQALLNTTLEPFSGSPDAYADAQSALSGQGSDPDGFPITDKKMYIRGKSWTAGTLAIASQTFLSAGDARWSGQASTGGIGIVLDHTHQTATATLTSPDSVIEPYRYISVALKGMTFSDRDVHVSFTNSRITKSFTIKTGADGVTVTPDIDGCAPNDVPSPFDVDRRRSRYPTLNCPTHAQSPIEKGPEEDVTYLSDVDGFDDSDTSVQGWLYGLSRATEVTISCALASGETLQVGAFGMHVVGTPTMTFLERYVAGPTGYDGFRRLWTYTAAGGDTTPVGEADGGSFSYLDVDGRGFLDFPSRWRDVPEGGSPSFVYPTISDWFGWNNAFPGITATEAGGFSSYWDNLIFIQFLGGDGDVASVANDGTVTWTSYIEKGLGTIQAQELLSRVRDYPGFGNGLSQGDYGVTTVYAGSKSLRARAEGIVLDPATLTPVSGALVTTGGFGTGTTDSRGYYRTGDPYGTTPFEHTTTYGAASDTVVWRARWRERTSFLLVTERGTVLALLSRGDGRLFRVTADDANTLLGVAATMRYKIWSSQTIADVTTDADLARLPGGSIAIGLLLDDEWKVAIDSSEGRDSLTLMTLGSATAGSLASRGNSDLFAFRVDGGTIKGTLCSALDLSIVDGPWSTNITALSDDARIATQSASTPGNSPAIVLLVTDGGTIVSYRSDDGRTFS